jgi:hypothetical protein
MNPLLKAKMMQSKAMSAMLLLAVGALFATASMGQQTATPAKPAAKATKAAPKKPAAPAVQLGLEPKAIDILKAASARLAAAKSMAFTAVVSYESPSRLGPPLIYSSKSEVILQRPNKLRVLTLGDGPASEFYFDGKTMMAFSPAENLVAVADAPATIDAALQAAYDTAAIYFPFTDVMVADPWKDIADGLKIAFYIGQSNIVGGITTDMVAYVTGDVFVQIWIGVDDKLPRRVYAVYLSDRARLRHVLELSNWQLDAAVPADAFASAKATGAQRIAFARPDAKDAPGMKPPPRKPKAAKAAPAKSK